MDLIIIFQQVLHIYIYVFFFCMCVYRAFRKFPKITSTRLYLPLLHRVLSQNSILVRGTASCSGGGTGPTTRLSFDGSFFDTNTNIIRYTNAINSYTYVSVNTLYYSRRRVIYIRYCCRRLKL